MKKLIATSAFLLVGIAGFSQPGPGRPDVSAEQIAQRQANALSERLSLSEDQRSKAYNVYLDAAKKNIAEREARMKEIQKQREAAEADQKNQSDKISQLLNADQKKTFQEMQARRREMGPGPGGPGIREGQRPQQGLGLRRGPGGDQLQRPGAPGQRFQSRPDGQNQQFRRPGAPERFQTRPDGQNQQFGRPGAPGQRFQTRPNGQNQQFGRPDARGPRLQGGQGQQLRGPGGQGRPTPRIFQNRPGRPDGFQQRDLKNQNLRQKFQKRIKRIELQKRAKRSADKAEQLQTAPDTKTAAPTENK
jgi:hypothetical protein